MNDNRPFNLSSKEDAEMIADAGSVGLFVFVFIVLLLLYILYKTVAPNLLGDIVTFGDAVMKKIVEILPV